MARVGLAGSWSRFPRTLADLLSAGHTLAGVGDAHGSAEAGEAFTLLLVVLGDEISPARAASLSQQHGVPWLGWDPDGDGQRTAAAYRNGALAVVPGDASPDNLGHAIHSALTVVRSRPTDQPPPLRQVHRASQIIPRQNGTVLELIEGVVAVRALHPDGVEVLLDLSGPGQLVISHPTDQCYVEACAHTPVTVIARAWDHMARDPELVERLRGQLMFREAWAAMQARPYLEQKLLGILTLLSERFGTEHHDGMLIDVHITHSLLASATGSTRPTVTRVLKKLTRTGQLATVGTGPRIRFVLTDGDA